MQQRHSLPPPSWIKPPLPCSVCALLIFHPQRSVEEQAVYYHSTWVQIQPAHPSWYIEHGFSSLALSFFFCEWGEQHCFPWGCWRRQSGKWSLTYSGDLNDAEQMLMWHASWLSRAGTQVDFSSQVTQCQHRGVDHLGTEVCSGTPNASH